jgi:membrane protein DedA with SNARE-associated domain
VILALGGVFAGQGELGLPGVIALGTLFGILGESTGFLLGRRYGDALLRRTPILRRFQRRLDQVEESIKGNAGKTIVMGRFVTGAAGLIPFVAGASGIRPRTFFTYTIPTVLLWASAVTLVGFFVGNHVGTIDRILSRVGVVGLGLVTLVVALWIWRHRRAPDPLPAEGSSREDEPDDL